MVGGLAAAYAGWIRDQAKSAKELGNIEAGVLLDDSNVATKLRRQFDSLVSAEILV